MPAGPTTVVEAWPTPAWWSTATTVTVSTTLADFGASQANVELLPEGVSISEAVYAGQPVLVPWAHVNYIKKAS